MKITHHIPTEQFGFTEVELAEGENTSYDEAKSLYGAVLPQPEGVEISELGNELADYASKISTGGISTKEFNEALDRYLTDGTGETDVYLRMSESQKAVFQEVKKSLKRIKAKQE